MAEESPGGASRVSSKQPDNTAARMAFVRAWETSLPPEERVCEDPWAMLFVPEYMRPMITTPQGRQFFLNEATKMLMGIMGFAPLRTRAIDDCLATAMDQGLEQLVLLGAGYDARPYRIEGLKNGVRVFEVDLPYTQSLKKSLLAEAMDSLPENVTFVPIDFENDSLAEALEQGGFSRKKTLFIWEGVTFYLDAEAVDRTLAFVARGSGPGSSIIFDYTLPGVIDGTSSDPDAGEIMEYAAGLGEPFKFGLDPAHLDRFLSDRGLELVENLSPDQCRQRYHTEAHADRVVSSLYNIAHARVRG